VVEEDRLLGRVQVSGVAGDLGQEGVAHEDGGFFLMARGRVAEQGGDIDLESAGEAVERGQRRHSLAVLDLRDVGAGNAHARGELALREIPDVTQIAHGGSYLQAAFGGAGCGLGYERDCGFKLGLLGQQGLLAAAADVGRRAVLHELARLATKDFSFSGRDSLKLLLRHLQGRHHGCHKLCCAGGSRARTAATHVR